MKWNRRLSLACASVLVVLSIGIASATIPPRPGTRWPQTYTNFAQRSRAALSNSRAFKPLMQRIQANRVALGAGKITLSAAQAAGGIAVTGSKAIPVLTSKFSNTPADPFAIANLQQELFTGPWPTGTMADFYHEISYGRFTVTGTVAPWRTLPQNDAFYESGCNAILCAAGVSKFPDFLKSTLDLNDASVDFSQYDNDGPDGVPNSGDDDGFVDFVAFVHPESGGECGNSNIWSHRFLLSGWGVSPYETNDAKAGGGKIRIDDYVVMPGLACDGTTMIQIGVFSHEFGHAFGLPDLYDTDTTNGDSEGIGNWCLMAGGSWGGDGHSPERPAHMSAWSKLFLGWLNPTPVTSDMDPASLANIEDNAVAFKIPISATEYYLISNRQKRGFDANLPAGGLLIWRINETVVNSGLLNNTVNADAAHKGVDLEEADGRADLDSSANRGDAGDVFPGSSNKTSFDNATNPKSTGNIAVCGIGNSADPMTAKLLVSTGKCSSPTSCTSLTVLLPPDGGDGPPGSWPLLLLPLLLGGYLALRGRRARRPAVLES